MISLLTAAIGLLAAAVIVVLIRRDRLHVRYGLWWMAVAALFALLGFLPGLFDRLAGALGVAYPPALVLTLGLVVMVVKILVMDIERSRNMVRLNRLVQRVAMLEAELRELQGGEGGDSQAPPGDENAGG